ncbi:unnamed protein product [Closterium sp. Yama58-4]|nr:unnamed protein product [Closterium sp. Yama58-4]
MSQRAYRKAKPDSKEDRSAMELHTAARNGDLEAVRRLIVVEGADVNARDKLNRTPLHLAAWAGHADVITLLCASKAAVNAAAADDTSALHFAAQKGHVSATRALLAEGAKPAAATRKGMTALHFAASKNFPEVVRLLARKGGKELLGMRNKSGEKAVDLAEDEEIKRLLEGLEEELDDASIKIVSKVIP